MKHLQTISILILLLFSSIVYAQDSTLFYYRLGVYHFNNANYSEATTYFTKLLQKDTKNINYLNYRAKSYLKCNKQSEAITDFLKVDSLVNGKASYDLSQLYATLGNTSKSIELLKKHLQSTYKLPESEIKLNKAFTSLSKTSEWTSLWKNDWYSDTESKAAEIRYLIKSDLLQDALSQATDFVNENPKLESAYDVRSDVYLASKELKFAINDLSTLIKLSPNKPSYYERRSSLYLLNNQYSKSLTDLSKLQELSPENIDLFSQKATIYLKMNKPDLALNELFEYEKYIDNAKVLEQIANCLFLCKKYKQSVEYYNKLIKTNLNRLDLFLKRGIVYLEMKEFTNAENDFTQVLDLDPRFAEAYYQRGIARYYKGDLNSACGDWKKADNLKHPDAFEYLKLCK